MNGTGFVAGLSHSVDITADLSDTVDNCDHSVGIAAGTTGGVVKATFQNGRVGVFPLGANGSLAIRCKRIWAVGTTATPIYALYG